MGFSAHTAQVTTYRSESRNISKENGAIGKKIRNRLQVLIVVFGTTLEERSEPLMRAHVFVRRYTGPLAHEAIAYVVGEERRNDGGSLFGIPKNDSLSALHESIVKQKHTGCEYEDNGD